MHKKAILSIISIIIVSVFLLVGCSPAVSDSTANSESQTSGQATSTQDTEQSGTEETTAASSTDETESTSGETPPEVDEIEVLIEQMTLREKVGQLFIIRPDSLDSSQTPEQVNDSSASGVTELSAAMADMLKNYPVGGIAMFGKNIVDEQQLITFISSLQDASSIPLLMAVDEEGGLVARLANHAAFDLPKYESAASVGATAKPSEALAMGNTIGSYLYRYGFNMDFAPVADVNTNPDNPVIGNRAFSSNGTVAAEMANAMAQGLKEQQIIPVFKHFPGHGDTAEDSHSGLAVNNKTKAEMESCEWLPYESLTAADCVMVGHIATPNITGDSTPATMSSEIVNTILRGQLGFDGVVMTDSLAMGAITNEYDAGEAAIKALKAGCDILLGPENFKEAFEAVVNAVENGTISEERIDESVYRILSLKQRYGLLT